MTELYSISAWRTVNCWKTKTSSTGVSSSKREGDRRCITWPTIRSTKFSWKNWNHLDKDFSESTDAVRLDSPWCRVLWGISPSRWCWRQSSHCLTNCSANSEQIIVLELKSQLQAGIKHRLAESPLDLCNESNWPDEPWGAFQTRWWWLHLCIPPGAS